MIKKQSAYDTKSFTCCNASHFHIIICHTDEFSDLLSNILIKLWAVLVFNE